MAAPVIQIDPNTGERIQPQGSIQIDPATGERINPPTAHPIQSPPDAPGYGKLFGEALFNPVGSGASAYPKPVEAALQVGGRAMQNITAPLLHPWQTIKGIGSTVKEAAQGAPNSPFYNPGAEAINPGPIAQRAMEFRNEWQQNKPLALENAAGDAIGTVEGGRMANAAIRGTAAWAGPKLQDIAASNLNQRMNVGTKDVQYGQNPGAGILKAGIGTSTRSGLVNKVQGAMDATGGIIGNVVRRADANANAPTLYTNQLRPYIEGPINDQLNVVRGPGNHALDPETSLTALRQSMTQRAPGARFSIYGPSAPDAVAPSDLWSTIRNIDKNTRFNPQPEIEGVNEIGRQIRGGLRSQLDTVDPSLKPASQTYADLASAQTALERQGAPYYQPQGLHAILQSTLNSYPVRTAVSSGLYKTGGILNRIGGVAMGPAAAAFEPRGVSSATPRGLPANVIPNADVFPAPRGYLSGATDNPLRPPAAVVTPPPRSPLALPATAGPGEAQPMIAVQAPKPYPTLAEEFARTRLAPTQFSGPPENPFGTPRALLNAANPPRKIPRARR